MTTRNARLRALVLERDHGVCSDCGLNTAKLQDAYQQAAKADAGLFLECARCTALASIGDTICTCCGGKRFRAADLLVARQEVVATLEGRRYTPKDIARLRATGGREPRLWQADHIATLREDGPDTLGNMRTLCLPDHRAWTRGLQSRLPHLRRMEEKKRRTHGETT